MEPKFQSSFIPKKPVVDSPKVFVPAEKERNIFSLLSTAVFVVTILVAGGLFGYKYYLDRQIAKSDLALNEAREAFEINKMKDLLFTSGRLKSINDLLNRHYAVSELMVFLQNSTVKSVKFNGLSFKNKDNSTFMVIEGESLSYNAIAVQSDILAKSDLISDLKFSDFALTTNGRITFRITGNVSPRLISYRELIEPAQSAESIEATQEAIIPQI